METSFVKDVSYNSTLSRADKALVKRNIVRSSQDRYETLIQNVFILFLYIYSSKLFRNSQVINSIEVRKKPKNQPKGYCFWALVFAVSIIAVANFFLTITIFR